MKALNGVRVLDLGRVVAAPFAGQLLADFGADVIKVERPRTGDDTRSWGPVYAPPKQGAGRGESAYFLAVNRGKRSITVDLSDPAGQKLLRELAAQSDVIIENFKVGDLARYGLDYASLSSLNPRIVYCSVTGFGQSGPLAERPGYDMVMQALSGLLGFTGEADGRPGAGPMRSMLPVADLFAGLYAALGIMAALRERELTGRGQHVDVSLLEALTCSFTNVNLHYLLSGEPPQRAGNANTRVVPNDIYPCGEGEIVLAVSNDGQFARLCTALGREDLAVDPRFTTNDLRALHRSVLDDLLKDALGRRSSLDWELRLNKVDVPCAPILGIAQALQQPQLQHRGVVREVEHASAGTIPTIANPIHFSSTPVTYERSPPALGQHTESVLRELLKLSAADITDLRRSGAI